MPALFTYWFLIIAALGPAIARYLYIRLREVAGDDPQLRESARRIAWVTLGIVSVPALFNALLQSLGDSPDGFFLFSNDFSNPIVIVGWLEPFCTAAVFIWWAWKTQGPATLVRFHKAFTRLPESTRGIQWFATVVPLGVVGKRTYDMIAYLVHGGAGR